MKLSKLGEFGLIEEVIAPGFKKLIRENITGIGDDCSITPGTNNLSYLFTTDMLIEKTHFLRDKITPFQLGFKSLAVNLSDIAAMGGIPTASYLSVGLPKSIELEWVKKFMKGYKTLSESENVPLLGGDTTSCEDKIIVNVGISGEIENSNIKRRNAARKNDIICVTGNLGDSAAGLQIILNQVQKTQTNESLLNQHLSPQPHVAEGKWLGAQKTVNAMMDVSDGVSSDLIHILKASGVSGVIELEQIPLSENLKTITKDLDWNPYELALSGGEDYVLLLTIDKQSYSEVAGNFEKQFNKPLHAIGHIERGKPQITYKEYGKTINNLKKGYTHF